MKRILGLAILAGLLAGCATGPELSASADADAKSVRNLVDTMHSAAHRFPANVPR